MRIGIDIGGTKIEGVVLDDSGTIAARRRTATPSDYTALVEDVTRLVHELERSCAAHLSVGVCAPGSQSPGSGAWRNAQNTPLDGHDFAGDLERALMRPVRLANDAHCFALSEAVDGAAAGARVVFGVIVGTGVGGGVVAFGRLLPGRNAIAGEWGHVPLPWPGDDECPGPACSCGKYGCIETFLSGPGLAGDHLRHTGARLGAEQIAARAAAGDRQCARTVDRYLDRMARALASVINLLDPDTIVVGGGLSALAPIYDGVPRRLGRYVLCDGPVLTRLVPARHGDASGVRGAACLWPVSPFVTAATEAHAL